MTLQKTIILVTLPLLVVMSGSSQSDVASDLSGFVTSSGGAVSTTPGSIYQGQSRGYINGGRLFARIPQRSVQSMSYKAPKFTAGCGGIDAFGGSLSFISASELVNTLKAIGSSAGSYALMLGLRTISSQIANTMEKSMDWLQDKIGFDLNSCEAAANVVGAGMSFFGANDKEKNVCIIQNMEASGLDYSEAKAACTTGGGGKTDVATPVAKKLSFIDGNLVWMIMDANQMFTTDTDMKRLAMSLTGTIIKRQVKTVASVEQPVSGDIDGQSKTEYFPSLMMTDDSILEAMLYGKTINRYGCIDDMTGANGCKQVNTEAWTISAADSLTTQTSNALMNLYDAVRNRTDPTIADMEFTTETSIPTMRIIRTAALLSNNGLGVQIINDYSEQIAIELLSTYINSIANGISAYSYEDSYGEEGAKLREGIALVQKKVRLIGESANISLEKSMQIAQQMQHYERIIISALPSNISRSMAWSAGGGH
jgi:conjugative transfer pilus assembly protein TraH